MRGAAVLVCLLHVAGAGAQTAAPPHLSLAEAIQRAQAHSYTAQGAQSRITGARARLLAAAAFTNPILLLSTFAGQDTGGLDENILLTQTIELGDKRRQRVYAARADRDASLADFDSAKQDAVFAVQSAYFAALQADVDRNLAVAALENATAFAKAADLQFQAGDVARSNVVRSHIELTRAQQALSAAETDRTNRYASLESLVQLPEDPALLLTDPLTYTPPTSYALSTLQALALRQRPDIRAAQRTRDSREAALHGARAQSQPDLLLEARRRDYNLPESGASVRVGVTFPVVDFGGLRANAHAAQASLTEQEAALQEAKRVALLDVSTSLRNLEEARRTVESFQAGRLNQAKELLDMAQTGYRQGANTYLELLDAQQVYRSEQAEYARALAAYNTAKAALQRAVGGTLP